MITKKPDLTEAQLREQVSDWLDIGVAQGKWIYLDRPAPRPGTSREGYQQRGRGNTGLRVKGGPDIILIAWAREQIQGYIRVLPIAIELKARYGTLSDAQKEMIPRWRQYGEWLTCKSLDEVKKGLTAIGITIPRES